MVNKQPKINVVIWDKPTKPTKAYVCKRSVLPNDRFIKVNLNGENVYYSNSTGMSLDEVPKKKIPRGCKEVSVKEANETIPYFG